jgi:hypothetical protein
MLLELLEIKKENDNREPHDDDGIKILYSVARRR